MKTKLSDMFIKVCNVMAVPSFILLLFGYALSQQFDISIFEYHSALFSLLPQGYALYILSNLILITLFWAIARRIALSLWFGTYDQSLKAIDMLEGKTDKKSLRALRISNKVVSIKTTFSKLNLSVLRPIRIFSILGMLSMVVFPMVPSKAADADSMLATYNAVQEDIVMLVANDYSLGLLEHFMGDIVSLVKLDPLSFDLLDAASKDQGKSFYEAYDGGLDFQFFTDTGTTTLVDGETTGYSVVPDSFLGYMSFFLSLIFQILLILAMVIRISITSAMSLSQRDSRGALKIAFQAISGASSLFVTMPFYKGFNIIGIFLVSCIVVGVGIANFAIILYFKFILVGSVSPPVFNPQTDAVFTQLVDRYVCSYAADASTAGFTEIKPKLVGNEIRLDFGKCGEFTIRDKAAYVPYAAAPRANGQIEISAGLENFKSQIKQEAKEKYLVALTTLILNAKEYAQSVVKLKLDLAQQKKQWDEYSYTTDLEEMLNDCKLYMARPDPDADYAQAFLPEFQKLCSSTTVRESKQTELYLAAKKQYSNDVANVIRNIINDLETHYTANEIQITSDGATTEVDKKFLNSDLSDVSVDAPATWQLYKAGWMKYPQYIASSRAYGKSITSIINLEVDGELSMDPDEFADGEGEDVMEALLFNKFIQSQIGSYEKALTDPHGVISKMAQGDSAMIEASTDLTSSLTTMDSVAVQKLVAWISFLILVEKGENVVTSLTDAGHEIIEYYLIFSAVNEVVGVFKKKKKDEDESEGFLGALGKKFKGLSKLVRVGIGVPIAAITGIAKPYIEFISTIMPNIFMAGNVLAFVVPALVYYFYTLAFLKWITQTIKTSILIAATPLKIFDSSGSDFMGKEVSSIIQMAIVIGASPMIIIGSFMAVEQGMTGVVNILQVNFYEFSNISSAPYTMGLSAMLFTLLGLILIPFIVMLWMYSFPISIQDALPQFLSLNLAHHSADGSLSNTLGYFNQMRRQDNKSPFNRNNPSEAKDDAIDTVSRVVNNGDTTKSNQAASDISNSDINVNKAGGKSDMKPLRK